MANRHANKKLRAAARDRMAATGESYQSALAGVIRRRAVWAPKVQADLLEIEIHGRPTIIAMVGVPGTDATLTMMYPSGAAAAVAGRPSLWRIAPGRAHWTWRGGPARLYWLPLFSPRRAKY